MRSNVQSQVCVKVHLASRDFLTGAGLRQLLQPWSFISVTGTSVGEDVVGPAVEAEDPDVLVLNAGSEREVRAVVDAARAVKESLKVVVLTDAVLAERLTVSRRTRLEGILLRGGDSLHDIGAVLRIVHAGGRVTSIYDEAMPACAPHGISPDLAARLKCLSVRETVILRELAKGRTNAEIAKPLHVSVATIKADLTRIMGTMGAFSRVHLAVLAVQGGFIDEPQIGDDTASGELVLGAGRPRVPVRR